MAGFTLQVPTDGFSCIAPIGYSTSPNCGYCRGESTDGRSVERFSYYASARSLSPDFYQSLIDRCWRRSGTLLYRPNQRHFCCPHYTIRLDTTAFIPTRDQRQAINRFNRHVVGDAYAKESARVSPRSREEAKRRDTVFDLDERIHEAESLRLPPLQTKLSKRQAERKRDSWPTEKTTIANSQEETATAPDAAAAGPPAAPPLPVEGQGILPAHRFDVTLEEDTFTEEKYLVFENYQRIIHHEPPSKISRSGFISFLCNSPVRRELVTDPDGQQRQLGSFHQCYRLDGKLVAIGVLDLLPHCVSAVYFLYHESIQQFSPGKLGALREIALARECGYRWWYAGYYIHSCPKMRYKIDYVPQYVLDPETYDWDLLDKETLAIFDKKPYVSMSRERRLRSLDANGGAGEDGKDPSDNKTGNNQTAINDSGDESAMEEEEDGADVGRGERSLLRSNMPGLPTFDDIVKLDLGAIPILISSQPAMFPIRLLVAWDDNRVRDWTSFTGRIVALVAAVGIELVPQLCLDFRRK